MSAPSTPMSSGAGHLPRLTPVHLPPSVREALMAEVHDKIETGVSNAVVANVHNTLLTLLPALFLQIATGQGDDSTSPIPLTAASNALRAHIVEIVERKASEILPGAVKAAVQTSVAAEVAKVAPREVSKAVSMLSGLALPTDMEEAINKRIAENVEARISQAASEAVAAEMAKAIKRELPSALTVAVADSNASALVRVGQLERDFAALQGQAASLRASVQALETGRYAGLSSSAHLSSPSHHTMPTSPVGSRDSSSASSADPSSLTMEGNMSGSAKGVFLSRSSTPGPSAGSGSASSSHHQLVPLSPTNSFRDAQALSQFYSGSGGGGTSSPGSVSGGVNVGERVAAIEKGLGAYQSALTRTVDALSRQLNRVDSSVGGLNKTVASIVASSSAQLTDATKTADDTRRDIDILRAAVEEARTRSRDELTSLMNIVRQQGTSMQDKLEANAGLVKASVGKSVAEVETRMRAVETSLQALEGRALGAFTTLDTRLSTVHQTLMSAISRTEAASESRASSLGARMDSLDLRVATASGNLEATVRTFGEERAQFNARVEADGNRRQELLRQQLEEAVAGAENRLKATVASTAGLRDELLGLINSVKDSVTSQVRNMQMENAGAANKSKEAVAAVNEGVATLRSTLEDRIATLQSQVSVLQAQASATDKDRLALQQLSSTVHTLKASSEAMKSTLESVSAQTRGRGDALEAQVESLASKLTADARDAGNSARAELEARCAALETAVGRKVEALSSDLASATSSWSAKERATELRVASLHGEVTENASSLRASFAALNSRFEELSASVVVTRSAPPSPGSSSSAISSEAISNRLSELSTSVGELRADVSGARQMATDAIATGASLTERVGALHAALNSRVDEVSARVASSETRLSSAVNNVTEQVASALRSMGEASSSSASASSRDALLNTRLQEISSHTDAALNALESKLLNTTAMSVAKAGEMSQAAERRANEVASQLDALESRFNAQVEIQGTRLGVELKTVQDRVAAIGDSTKASLVALKDELLGCDGVLQSKIEAVAVHAASAREGLEQRVAGALTSTRQDSASMLAALEARTQAALDKCEKSLSGRVDDVITRTAALEAGLQEHRSNSSLAVTALENRIATQLSDMARGAVTASGDSLTLKIDAVKSDLANSLTSLKSRVENFAAIVAAGEETSASTRDRVEKIGVETTALARGQESIRANIETLGGRVSTVEKAVDSHSITLNNLSADLASAASRISTVEASHSTTTSGIASLTDRLTAAEISRRSDTSSLETRLSALDSSTSERLREVDRFATERLSTLQASSTRALAEARSALEARISTLGAETTSSLSSLSERVSSAADTASLASAGVAVLQSATDRIRASTEAVTTRLDTVSSNASEALALSRAANQRHEDVSANIDSIHAASIPSLMARMDALTAKLGGAENASTAQASTLNDLATRASSLEDRLERLHGDSSTSLTALERDVARFRASVEGLESSLSSTAQKHGHGLKALEEEIRAKLGELEKASAAAHEKAHSASATAAAAAAAAAQAAEVASASATLRDQAFAASAASAGDEEQKRASAAAASAAVAAATAAAAASAAEQAQAQTDLLERRLSSLLTDATNALKAELREANDRASAAERRAKEAHDRLGEVKSALAALSAAQKTPVVPALPLGLAYGSDGSQEEASSSSHSTAPSLPPSTPAAGTSSSAANRYGVHVVSAASAVVVSPQPVVPSATLMSTSSPGPALALLPSHRVAPSSHLLSPTLTSAIANAQAESQRQRLMMSDTRGAASVVQSPTSSSSSSSSGSGNNHIQEADSSASEAELPFTTTTLARGIKPFARHTMPPGYPVSATAPASLAASRKSSRSPSASRTRAGPPPPPISGIPSETDRDSASRSSARSQQLPQDAANNVGHNAAATTALTSNASSIMGSLGSPSSSQHASSPALFASSRYGYYGSSAAAAVSSASHAVAPGLPSSYTSRSPYTPGTHSAVGLATSRSAAATARDGSASSGYFTRDALLSLLRSPGVAGAAAHAAADSRSSLGSVGPESPRKY